MSFRSVFLDLIFFFFFFSFFFLKVFTADDFTGCYMRRGRSIDVIGGGGHFDFTSSGLCVLRPVGTAERQAETLWSSVNI